MAGRSRFGVGVVPRNMGGDRRKTQRPDRHGIGPQVLDWPSAAHQDQVFGLLARTPVDVEQELQSLSRDRLAW